MKARAVIAVGTSVLVVVVGLAVLAAPVIFGVVDLARPAVSQTPTPTASTEPAVVEVDLSGFSEEVQTFLAATGINGRIISISHEQADAEYAAAVATWPWALPEEFSLPESRGSDDTPGSHWTGMGTKAAFDSYAARILTTIQQGASLEERDHLLNEFEDAARTLNSVGVVVDPKYVDKVITPLRVE